jgi:putative sigma-54 modulation protein
MDVVIRGRGVDVSETLRASALKQLHRIGRFADGPARAEVDFSEERNPRIADHSCCEVILHVKGHTLTAHASAPEPFAAVSLAVEKVEHQVKRLKEKRVTRTHPRGSRVGSPDRAPDGVDALAWDDVSENSDDQEPARIVKTKQFSIKPMSAEEAALQMDLLGHSFFFFTSSENGRAAVLYRRNDGNFGLIESAG